MVSFDLWIPMVGGQDFAPQTQKLMKKKKNEILK